MAYDPKKKRPKAKSLDSVVDEIFGEESVDPKPKTQAKKSASPKPAPKKPTTAKVTNIDTKVKKPVSPVKPVKTAEKVAQTDDAQEIPDNVTEFVARNEETPLIMQPQVWIATAVAALIVLVIARKKKR